MIGVNMEEFLWCQKYRPQTVQDAILPKDLKDTFQKFVDDKNVPNLLLSGSAGVGKTTVARAMLDELGADYIVINGSMNGNIDTLRVDIQNFASTVSFMGGRKYVILDEADYLNANSTQPALRNFMEEFSKNCGFILTCNFEKRIIEPLHSRCSVINFNINTADRPKLASQFFKRTLGILDAEGIQYEQKAVAELINTYFPDWRRVLNELQRYSATGRIDAGILRNKGSESIESLIVLLKEKRFNEVRKWIGENSDIDSSTLYRSLYDIIPSKMVSTSSIANAVIILAEYEYKEAFVANPEINRAAAMATLMAEVSDWK
jgi:DNA polymerase III delta prime subunit